MGMATVMATGAATATVMAAAAAKATGEGDGCNEGNGIVDDGDHAEARANVAAMAAVRAPAT